MLALTMTVYGPVLHKRLFSAVVLKMRKLKPLPSPMARALLKLMLNLVSQCQPLLLS